MLSLQGLGFPSNETQGSAAKQALLNKRSRMLQIHQKLGLLTAIPMKCSDFKITRPELLAMPIKDDVPVSVNATWAKQ